MDGRDKPGHDDQGKGWEGVHRTDRAIDLMAAMFACRSRQLKDGAKRRRPAARQALSLVIRPPDILGCDHGVDMFRWIIILGATLWASATVAAETVGYGPPAEWVRPADIPDIAQGTDGSPLQTLLLDSQSRLGPDRDEFYIESAIRILTPQGLASAATLPISWSRPRPYNRRVCAWAMSSTSR
jgi:hypothetical protein